MRAAFVILSAGFLATAALAPAALAQDKPSYCVNAKADFYPYQEGQTCKKGYQLAGGNCKLQDGRMVAVAKSDCLGQAGEVALPSPAVRFNGDADAKQEPEAKPLTVKNPKPQ